MASISHKFNIALVVIAMTMIIFTMPAGKIFYDLRNISQISPKYNNPKQD